MMKKGRRVSMELSPSSSSYPIGEEAKKRFKHQSLMQDYLELLKETEAKRKKIWMANQKKLELLAVVKFLRRKFKSLSKNPARRIPFRLKKRPLKRSSPTIPISKNPIVHSDVPLKDRNQERKETASPNPSLLLDLNQLSLPNGEEVEEFQLGSGPLRMDLSTRCLVDGEGDAGNGVNHIIGKKKISWQDQVALRV